MKYTRLLFFMFLATWMSVGAYAQSNRINIPGVTMSRGGETVLSVNMDNIDEVTAVEFTLEVPTGFTINPVSAVLSERGANHQMTARKLKNGKYKFVIMSEDNTPIQGIAGELFTLQMNAAETLTDGVDYPIIISNAVMALKSGKNVLQETDAGKVTIKSLPNLHVVSLDCSEAVAGSDMTVKWKVRNDGRGSTEDIQWKDYVWLVPNVEGGTSMRGTKLLKTVNNVTALQPGESYENTVNIHLEERIYGNYDIVVVSDKYGINNINFATSDGNAPRPYEPDVNGFLSGYPTQKGTVLEENESTRKTDNFFYRQINITVPPLADLQVPAITAYVIPTTDIQPGASDAGSRMPKKEVIYNPTEPTEDELLMPWYEAYIPNALSAANLRHSNAFYSGKKIKVKVKVANKGGKDTQKSFKTVLYMSSSPDVNAAPLYAIDSKTCSKNIHVEGDTVLTFAFYMPYSWFGETYFHAYADIDDAVYELANTENNWGVSSNYNFLLCPGADFVPSKIRTSTQVSSSPFTISYRVDNQGAGIPYQNTWKDKVYLSSKADGLDDSAIEIGSFEQTGSFYLDTPRVTTGHTNTSGGGTLIPSYQPGSQSVSTTYPITTEPEKLKYQGDSYNASRTVQIPHPVSGTYYIYVKVDAKDDVFEYDGESNNITSFGPIQVVAPDLAVELQSISEETLITENKVAVTWKLKNVGTANIQNATVTDGFYACSKADGADSVRLGTAKNVVSIPAGGEKTFRTNITIPRHQLLDGSRYFFIKTNISKAIDEVSYANNMTALATKQFVYVEDPAVVKVNGTNLTVSALQIASSVTPGQSVPIAYTIKNTGTLSIDSNVKQEVFISDKNYFDSSAKALTVEGTFPSVADLQADQSVTANINVTIPKDMKGGQKYIFVCVNRDKTLAEKKTDDNSVKSPVYIGGNLPNLTISNLVVPSAIATSVKTKITWTLSNSGDWESKSTTCYLYLSEDANYNSGDKLLATVIADKLAKYAKKNMEATIELNDDVSGNFHLKAVVKSSQEELTTDDNTATAAFTANQSPLPDLAISDIVADGTIRSGEKVTVKAKIQNIGDDATHKDKWSDVFYLSTDFALNRDKATNVGSKVHVGKLEKDGSYEVTATLNIPTNAHGYYFLYAVTDGSNVNIEKDKENNVTRIRIYVENGSDTPAELAISGISAPSNITAGVPVTISYTLANNGQYPANGNLREVIYLSENQQWDENDQMVGVVTSSLNLHAGNEEFREVTGRITNVVEGSYYVIIRTNSTHTIAETDYDNNTVVAHSPCKIEFANLALESTATVNTSGYYKLSVGTGWAGRTIGFYLSHNSEVPAGLYVSYNKVPSTARYDRSSNVIEATEQEVLIPNVQEGNYYILAQDNNATGLNLNEFKLNGADASSGSTMNLSAKEVHFGASTLSITEGGTDGWLTTEIHGALLDSIMDFRLVKEGKAIPVEALTFHDQTYTHATFNLHDASTGSYDVVSELPNGTTATLPDGFRVIPGQSVNLGVKMDLPAGGRSNFYAPFSIAYANSGNTDIAIKELLVVTENGVLSTTIEGLKEGKRELHIVPNMGQDNRGYVNIPPGTHEVINCFIYLSATSQRYVNHVNVFIVK